MTIHAKNAILLTALILLNIWDAVFTMYGIQKGVLVEVNPVMAAAYDVAPWFFLLAKAALLGFGIMVGWSVRDDPWSTKVLMFCVGLYTLLFFYELWLGFHFIGAQ